MTSAGPRPRDEKKRKAGAERRKDEAPLAELPDPRLRPLTRPQPERVAPPRLAAMKAMGGVGTIGLEIALSIMIGLFGGQWLDGRFGTSPWLTLVGSAFGVATAIRAITRQMRIMKKEAAKEEALEGNPAQLWESDADRKRREDEAPFPGSDAPDSGREKDEPSGPSSTTKEAS